WYRLGTAKLNLGDAPGAEAAFQSAAQLHYFESQCLLLAASAAAKADRPRASLLYLHKLTVLGFDQPRAITSNPQFAKLSRAPDFNAILESIRRNVRWQSANPRWSADGRKIIFERGLSEFPASVSQVFSIDVDDGKEAQLTRGAGNHMMPDLSPDGRSIVYSA